MACEGLGQARTALQRAMRIGHENVRCRPNESATAKRPGPNCVRPTESDGQELLLVSFIDEPKQKRLRRAGATKAASARTAALEQRPRCHPHGAGGAARDLATASEDYQAINEEAMTVNEEYQSTNEELKHSKEELRSSNEELEISKQELQSLNEELTALNQSADETVRSSSATRQRPAQRLAQLGPRDPIPGPRSQYPASSRRPRNRCSASSSPTSAGPSAISPHPLTRISSPTPATCSANLAPLSREIRTAERVVYAADFAVSHPGRHGRGRRSSPSPTSPRRRRPKLEIEAARALCGQHHRHRFASRWSCSMRPCTWFRPVPFVLRRFQRQPGGFAGRGSDGLRRPPP